MTTEEQEAKKHFNNVYLIAKHKPELFAQLEKGLESSIKQRKIFVAAKREVESERKRLEKPVKPITKEKNVDRGQ